MDRSYGLILYCCFIFFLIAFANSLTTETYASRECEEETLIDTVYGRKRTFQIEFDDKPIEGFYALATEYFEEDKCSGNPISTKIEFGIFQLLTLGDTGYDLIGFLPKSRNISFIDDNLHNDFITECDDIDLSSNKRYDVSNITCNSFKLYDIISCNKSIQPREFLRKDYIRFGYDAKWCDWEVDKFKNLSNFGPYLDYQETNLEKAERTFSNVISYIQLVLMALSILGAFITILTFLIFPRIRTYPIKLICWLCLSILIGQIMFIIVSFEAKGTNFCEAGGAFVHYFFLSNFTWCSCLAFNFYQLIVKRNSQTRDLEKYYHLFGWGLPLLFVMAVGISKSYGEAGSTCYMNNSWAVFLGFFLPGLIILAANFVLFFFVSTEIHGTLSKAPQTEQKSKENTKEFRVLFSIFVTVGLTWVFGFIVAIADYDKSRISYFIFTALFTITAPAQGLFVFIAYCINKKVINRWKGLFGCKVSETEQTTSATASGRSSRGATKSSASSTSSSRMD